MADHLYRVAARGTCKQSRLALIGAPMDIGAGNRGAASGPASLRAAGLGQALSRQGYHVIDRGDLCWLANVGGRTLDGCKHLDEIAAWCRAVRDAVGNALESGELPVLLGGDRALAMGSVAAVARHGDAVGKPLSILWLDAHADFNTAESSPSGNLHGMPVAAIVGDGHPALIRLGHGTPMVDVANVVQIGVRSIDVLEQKRIDARGLRVYGTSAIRARGMRAVVEEALADIVRRGGHLHVSFDVDFLDPLVAPGVGTPEHGGPTLREAEACRALIRETGLVGSVDIVELAPAFDRGKVSSRRVVSLIQRMLGRPSGYEGRLHNARRDDDLAPMPLAYGSSRFGWQSFPLI